MFITPVVSMMSTQAVSRACCVHARNNDVDASMSTVVGVVHAFQHVHAYVRTDVDGTRRLRATRRVDDVRTMMSIHP